MSTLNVLDLQGKSAGEFDLADELLVQKKGTQAVHDVIVAYQAGLRAGTASTLRKGEVAGSNIKPWKQKGTGRARAGYRQSPVWRGGGVAFGPHPRSYTQRIPRKVVELAFRRAFSDRVVAGDIQLVTELTLSEAKTKAAAALLKNLKIEGCVLFVVHQIDPKVRLALRNLPKVGLSTVSELNTYTVLLYPKIVITRAAMEQIQGRLSGRKAKAA